MVEKAGWDSAAGASSLVVERADGRLKLYLRSSDKSANCWDYSFPVILRALLTSPTMSMVPQSIHMVEKMGTYPV